LLVQFHVCAAISPTSQPKRLFVFVTPLAAGNARKMISDTEIKLLFEAAGMSIAVQGSAC